MPIQYIIFMTLTIPVIQIFDMEKNIFAEMKVKISDYILLKMYFERYKIMVDDNFKIL